MSNTLASDTVVSITEEAEDDARWKNEALSDNLRGTQNCRNIQMMQHEKKKKRIAIELLLPIVTVTSKWRHTWVQRVVRWGVQVKMSSGRLLQLWSWFVCVICSWILYRRCQQLCHMTLLCSNHCYIYIFCKYVYHDPLTLYVSKLKAMISTLLHYKRPIILHIYRLFSLICWKFTLILNRFRTIAVE